MSEWTKLGQHAGQATGAKKDNSGVLFRNDRKEPGTRQPDHTGNCTIHGKDFRIAAWIKVSKAGKKYFSLAFSVPGEEQAKRNQMPLTEDLDDEIPGWDEERKIG